MGDRHRRASSTSAATISTSGSGRAGRSPSSCPRRRRSRSISRAAGWPDTCAPAATRCPSRPGSSTWSAAWTCSSTCRRRPAPPSSPRCCASAAAPRSSPRRSAAPVVDRAEALVSDFIRDVCGYEQGQLQEHRDHGWPNLDASAAAFEAAGWHVRVFGYGSVWTWVLMMIDKHALQAMAGSKRAQIALDRAFNETRFAADREPPCYRHFVVATQSPEDPVLAFVESAYGAVSRAAFGARPPLDPAVVASTFALLEAHAANQRIQARLEPERQHRQLADVDAHRARVVAALERDDGRGDAAQGDAAGRGALTRVPRLELGAPSRGSSVTVSFILAGAVWPDAACTRRAVGSITDACPGAEVIEAREARDTPRGAAAVIGDAIRGARGEVVVVLEPWAGLDVEALRALAAAGGTGLAIEAGPMSPRCAGRHCLPAPIWSPNWRRWRRRRRRASRRSTAGRCRRGPSAGRSSTTPVDSIGRVVDVGLLEDLAARLPGAAVLPVDTGASGGRTSAWPLDPALQVFLARRNRSSPPSAACPADRLGVELARVTVEALHAATAASGLTGDQFRFGGGWGAAEAPWRACCVPAPTAPRTSATTSARSRRSSRSTARSTSCPACSRFASPRRSPGPEPAARPRSQPAAEPGAQPTAALPELPSVSVIVVNWNGRDHLGPASRRSRERLPADLLELICVDNGSMDDSRACSRERFPDVRVVALRREPWLHRRQRGRRGGGHGRRLRVREQRHEVRARRSSRGWSTASTTPRPAPARG